MATIRERALGAWWYWGTESEAAEALGISRRTFARALETGKLTDEQEIAFRQGFLRKTADQRYAMEHGYTMVQETLTFDQAELLKRKGFKGRRFVTATRAHERRKGRIPKNAVAFIQEVGSP